MHLESFGNFVGEQDPLLNELDQDPMLYDVGLKRMISSGKKASDSYGRVSRGRVPGARRRRGRGAMTNGRIPNSRIQNGRIPNLNKISMITRIVIMREIKNDPSMIPYIKNLLSSKKPAQAVFKEVRKVMINQLDPTRYSDLAGRWPLLRQSFVRNMKIDRLKRYAGMSGLGDDESSSVEKLVGTKLTGVGSSVAKVLGSLFDTAKPWLDKTLKRNTESSSAKKARREARTASEAGTEVSRGQFQEMAAKEQQLQMAAAREALAKQELENQRKLERQVSASEKPSMLPYAVPLAAASIPIFFRKK